MCCLPPVVLSQLDESEVVALYTGHETAPFDTLESLIEKLRSYRKAGFAYEEGLPGNENAPDDESSLALTVPGNPQMAIAVNGRIPMEDMPMRLEELREAVAKISRCL